MTILHEWKEIKCSRCECGILKIWITLDKDFKLWVMKTKCANCGCLTTIDLNASLP